VLGRRKRLRSVKDTADAFVTAAMALMARSGRETMPSVQAICKRAGYGRATFYEHFDDRDAVLEAVITRIAGDLTHEALRVEPRGDFGAMIAAFAGRVAGRSSTAGTETETETETRRANNKQPWKLKKTLDLCSRSPIVRKRHAELLNKLRTTLADELTIGQKSGRVRSDIDARGLANLLVALSFGSAVLVELEALADPKSTAATLIALTRP
jgi:AcrR family transcriptional regulator